MPEPTTESRQGVVYIDEPGGQPCGYCWGWSPPEGWDMENVSEYLPRGDGWVGLAPTHPECEESVAAYAEASYIENRGSAS